MKDELGEENEWHEDSEWSDDELAAVTVQPKEPAKRAVRQERYYVNAGRNHDYALRCHECKRIVRFSSLVKSGSCPRCGNRPVTEITSLTLWEWLKIRLGLLRFPDSEKFMKEFSRGS